MSAVILDGKKLAEWFRGVVGREFPSFRARPGREPGLRVVLVGEDPASQVYTRNKEKASKEVGIQGELVVLPAATSQKELLALLETWNRDDAVDGILVQLPLPKQIDSLAVLDAIHPDKDVDGFHPENVGLLASGRPG